MLFYGSCSFGQKAAELFVYQQPVDSLIKWVKNRKVEKIATRIRYPLNRNYPLPDILNENQFIAYYDTLFDEKLKETILSSGEKERWKNMGGKGIKLNEGILWLDHNFYITSINYHSDIERKEYLKLLEIDKQSVHPSIHDFLKPVMIIKTKSSIIRIDKMTTKLYRYSQWDINSSTLDKPKFVINEGTILPSENDFCIHYQFHDDGFSYMVYCGIVSIQYKGEEIKLERGITVKN